MKIFFIGALLMNVIISHGQKMVSPNGKIAVEMSADGYGVTYEGLSILTISKVGVTTASRGGEMALESVSKKKTTKTNYTMLVGKRLKCQNKGNEYVFNYKYSDGAPLRLVMRLYNDGIAFRYELSDLKEDKFMAEQTTYTIPKGIRRWMMPWSEGYEGFYSFATSGEAASHWAYPALIQPAEDVFMLLTEANIERRQSASSLKNNGDKTQYVVCPETNDVPLTGEWHTPWRVIIMGSLADVVESTLVTDVSEPSTIHEVDWIKPGMASWVYWAHNHGSNDFNIIKRYVDMAVALKLPYVLIDAEWDEFKDGKTVEDAIHYANQCGVKPMIWYNSSVGWLNGAPGPKFRLNKPEDREKEFAWCEAQGIKGVKIDFFSGDNQMNMDYCLDLLESAARHHLTVNFHGATVPRGWQRTYPNLMTVEGVYGAEWYNNVPTFTKKAATHNATLPFTRNVIGSMDYTPCAFTDSQHPHITTHAHELALTVLFESGTQHLADRPEGFLSQPERVQTFLSKLPNVWDETILLGGYPGEYVAMARRNGTYWYVALINGSDTDREVQIDWKRLKLKKVSIDMFADSGNANMPWELYALTELPQNISLRPRGGCVMVITAQNKQIP